MNTHKSFRTVLAVAVLMLVMAGFLADSALAQSTEGDDRAAALRIFELVNRDRTQAGLPPLADRADVTSVAASWSASMAQARVLSHNDNYFSAESRQRLSAKILGENVASNASVDNAHERLMASPSHHANIMSTKFTVVGIAVYRDAGGTYWVTEDFLMPKTTAAPAPAAAPSPAPAPAPVVPAGSPTTKAVAAPRPTAPAATLPAPSTTAQAASETATASQMQAELPEAALISAPRSPRSTGWNRGPLPPVAAAGSPLLAADRLPLAAASGNALVALGLIGAYRRRQAA